MISKLSEFMLNCKEFLGINGLRFTLPLLLLGFTECFNTNCLSHNDKSINSHSHMLSVFHSIMSEFKYCSKDFNNLVLWENAVQATLIDILQGSVKTATDTLNGEAAAGQHMEANQLHLVFNRILGTLHMLDCESLRQLMLYESAPSDIMEYSTVDFSKKLIYMMVHIMSPCGSSFKGKTSNSVQNKLILLLEEREYACDYGHVLTGYYNIAWDFVSDSDLKSLIKRTCYYFGKFQLLNKLLQTIHPMESLVHKVWKNMYKSAKHVHDQLLIANSNELKEEKYSADVRIAAWKQSISVWKLIGNALLGLCSPFPLESEYGSASEHLKKSTSNSRSIHQCAVCNRTSGLVVEAGKAASSQTRATFPIPLSRCSKCKLVYYCCKEHQQSDWKVHKLVCNTASSHAMKHNELDMNEVIDNSSSNITDYCIIDPEKLLVNVDIQQYLLKYRNELKTASNRTMKQEDLDCDVSSIIELCVAELKLYITYSQVINIPSAKTSNAIILQNSQRSNINDKGATLTLSDGSEKVQDNTISFAEHSYMSIRTSCVLECLAHSAFVLRKSFKIHLIKVTYSYCAVFVD